MEMPSLIKSIVKVDDYTVKFVLNRPKRRSWRTSPCPSPRSCRRNMPTRLKSRRHQGRLEQQLPIGTGPFKFVAYQKDAVIRYAKNPDYWGTAPRAIDDLVFAITPDAAVRLQKLKAGECQLMPYPAPADLAGDQG
jgi:dipeptide transport system substrate-binding protein